MRITLKIWKFFKRNIPSPALKIPHCYPRYTDTLCNQFRYWGKVVMWPKRTYIMRIRVVTAKIQTVQRARNLDRTKVFIRAIFLVLNFDFLHRLSFGCYRPYSPPAQVLVQMGILSLTHWTFRTKVHNRNNYYFIDYNRCWLFYLDHAGF